MGKGDKKSKKGKIWRGSYGVSRKRKKNLQAGSAGTSKTEKAEVKADKPKKRTARKKKAE